jgi:hypothetical protein
MEATNKVTASNETYSINIKFNTQQTCVVEVTNSTTIGDVMKKCILKYIDHDTISYVVVPDTFLNKCKLVFNGKILSTLTNPITSIEGITGQNALIFCIMAVLTNTEIKLIEESVGPTNEKIMSLITSESLKTNLMNPTKFAYICDKIGVNFCVPQPQINELLASEQLLTYLKSSNNYNEIVEWVEQAKSNETHSEVCSEAQNKYKYLQALNEIVAMGFKDNDDTRCIISKHKGNLENSVNDLLSHV